jgi:two-component system, LytTR family, response regulator
MQLRCVVIDDEPWALELMKKYVGKIPFLKLVHTLCDPSTAIDFLKDIDLVFIDINIPSSIDLLSSMTIKPMMIFITAYKKYALRGFEIGAIDYLLKPLDFGRFNTAVRRALELFETRQYSKQAEQQFLFVRSENKTVRIQLNEIEFIEARVNYIMIHRIHDDPVLTPTSLREISKKIPAENFQRIHRSYIVAISQIKELQNKKVLMNSMTELPVSHSYSWFAKGLKKDK